MDVIERATAAMVGESWNATNWRPEDRETCRASARRVIEAIREPTQEMIAAVMKDRDQRWRESCDCEGVHIRLGEAEAEIERLREALDNILDDAFKQEYETGYIVSHQYIDAAREARNKRLTP